MRLTKSSHYLFQKRDIYYYSRRVPSDLLGSYSTPRVVLSLKTKSLHFARSRAASLSAKLEEEWQTIRFLNKESLLSRFLATGIKTIGEPSNAPKLSEAKKIYLSAKADNRAKTFRQAADRCVGYVVELLGDRPIDSYGRPEVNKIRDTYVEAGLSPASIKRNLSTIRAIVNFGARESGISEVTAFSGVYLGETGHNQPNKRPSFPIETLKNIQSECVEFNDEARWLIALVSDSGLRLSEAAGLLVSDLMLTDDVPHIE